MAGPGGSDTQYWREVEDIFASVLDAEPARREEIGDLLSLYPPPYVLKPR